MCTYVSSPAAGGSVACWSRAGVGESRTYVFAAKDFYAEGDNLVRWTPSQPGMAPLNVWRNSS